jgi:hypothetical protein
MQAFVVITLALIEAFVFIAFALIIIVGTAAIAVDRVNS